MSTPLHLKNIFSPGDIVTFTAAIRDLAVTYPNKYDIKVTTRCPQLLQNNPYITNTTVAPKNNTVIDINYAPHIPRRANAPKHFVTVYHKMLEQKLGIPIPVLKPHGDLYLDPYMQENRPIDDKYWVVFCGSKIDWPTKIWPASKWQVVIDKLAEHGISTVQSGHTTNEQHIQPKLNTSLNLVGWGGLTEMMWLIYHSEGVMGYISAPMHIAACFNKPCVVLAGGKEPVAWEAYTNDNLATKFGTQCTPLDVEHRYLHTFGQLPCCSCKNVCWARVLEKDAKSRKICSNIITEHGYKVAACMNLITPEMVVDAVLSYDLININKDPEMGKVYSRVVAITPLLMLDLDKKSKFRKDFAELHTMIGAAQKDYKRCCRSTKEVLAYNKAWNEIKRKVLEIPEEARVALKKMAEVKSLIVNYKDDSNRIQRVVI